MMNFPAADPSVVFQPPVEVRLATAFRTPPASAIKINLAGGTIKAARTDFSQAAYLNWTTGTFWYTGGTNQTSWIGATNSETLTVPGSGLLKGSTRFNASLAVHGTVAPGDAHETVTFEARNLTIGTTGAGGVRGRFAADIDFDDATADVLSITGTVNLANARLSLALLDAPAGLAAPLTFLLIVKNGSDAVAGTFAAIGSGGCRLLTTRSTTPSAASPSMASAPATTSRSPSCPSRLQGCCWRSLPLRRCTAGRDEAAAVDQVGEHGDKSARRWLRGLGAHRR